MITSAEIKQALKKYHSVVHDGVCDEISNELQKRGMEENEFYAAFGQYRKSERRKICPDFRDLKKYLGGRRKQPRRSQKIMGIDFPMSAAEAQEFDLHYSGGYRYYWDAQEHEYKTIGERIPSDLVKAAMVLQRNAINEKQKRASQKFMEHADLEMAGRGMRAEAWSQKREGIKKGKSILNEVEADPLSAQRIERERQWQRRKLLSTPEPEPVRQLVQEEIPF